MEDEALKVFGVYNLKGGVGKTATAVNLAYLSACSGARTLVWDLDPQGAASFYFRIRPKIKGGSKRLLKSVQRMRLEIRGTDYDDLDLLPADFSYRKMDLNLSDLNRPSKRLATLLEPMTEEYDHIFLDCAPSVSLTSESVFVAADALLVPTIPTPLSLRTVEQLHRHLEAKGPARLEVLPFFCMVDSRKTLHRETCDRVDIGGFPALETHIPYASQVEQMGLRRAPLAAFAPSSPAAKAYEALWAEISDRLARRTVT